MRSKRYRHKHTHTHTHKYNHSFTYTLIYTHVDIIVHTLTYSRTHMHTAQASLWYEGRRLVLSSEEFPLNHAHPSRLSSIKTPPKFYLFDDAFVVVQVCRTSRRYKLDIFFANSCTISIVSSPAFQCFMKC